MKKKKLIGLALLSLLIGAGLAGGLYVISTPTKIAPKASDGTGFSLENPLSRQNPAVATPRREAESFGSGERTAGVTSAQSGPLTEQAIIDAFGTTSSNFDINKDGIVNSLDLLEFRKTLLK